MFRSLHSDGYRKVIFSRCLSVNRGGTPWTCHWSCPKSSPWSCLGIGGSGYLLVQVWQGGAATIPPSSGQGAGGTPSPGPGQGVPPDRTRTDVRCGRYASSVYAGGLSCSLICWLQAMCSDFWLLGEKLVFPLSSLFPRFATNHSKIVQF